MGTNVVICNCIKKVDVGILRYTDLLPFIFLKGVNVSTIDSNKKVLTEKGRWIWTASD